MDKKTARYIWMCVKSDCGYFDWPFKWCMDCDVETEDVEEFFDFVADAIEQMEEPS